MQNRFSLADYEGRASTCSMPRFPWDGSAQEIDSHKEVQKTQRTIGADHRLSMVFKGPCS